MTHDHQAKAAIAVSYKACRRAAIRAAARIEGYSIIFDGNFNEFLVTPNLHTQVQFLSVRCAVAQDVADDFFEDKLDVVARTRRPGEIFSIEGLSQLVKGACEAR